MKAITQTNCIFLKTGYLTYPDPTPCTWMEIHEVTCTHRGVLHCIASVCRKQHRKEELQSKYHKESTVNINHCTEITFSKKQQTRSIMGKELENGVQGKICKWAMDQAAVGFCITLSSHPHKHMTQVPQVTAF